MTSTLNIWDEQSQSYIPFPVIQGSAGIHYGESEPTDPNHPVWINPTGDIVNNNVYELISELQTRNTELENHITELSGKMVDYIVEQGELNGWTYRKWNSGFAECEMSATVNYSINASEAKHIKTYNLPFDFTQINHPLISGGDWFCNYYTGLNGNTGVLIGVKNINNIAYSDQNAMFSVRVTGKWK